MCFSAGASFGAGVVLTVIGVASIKKAKSPSQIPFASIPLIFGVQQITEGFLWLAFLNPEYASLQQVAMYNFLFFAQVVWPVWVPFAILKLEPKENRRLISKILAGIGAAVSVYLGFCMINYPVEASVIGNHISYHEIFPPSLRVYVGILYSISTISPTFFSRIRRMWMLGTTVIVSYVITAIFYTDYIISVWCFFASIISIAIYVIMESLEKQEDENPVLIKANDPKPWPSV
ncbi:MAG: hypothetical protein PSV36_04295 [Algoriphagus sp.]|nr:hypothetical protein [Algoriphagus sp.]